MSNLFLDSGATFSEDRKYRQLLWRIWDNALPLLCVCLLNPSVAAEDESDSTVTRQIERAHRLGCGGLLVVNAYDFVSTDPKYMKSQDMPSSPENDAAIVKAATRAVDSGGMVICGWGGNCTQARHNELVRLLQGIPLHALKVNADGSPQHPLYLGYSVQPVRWP